MAEDNFTIQEMRDTIKRLEERAKAAEKLVSEQNSELKGYRITKTGFPEDSPGFKVLTDFYDGDLADVAAMREFAGRYGHNPAEAPKPGAQADVVEAEDRRLGGLQATAAAAVPGTAIQQVEAQIREAEAAGDAVAALRLKSQLHQLQYPTT